MRGRLLLFCVLLSTGVNAQGLLVTGKVAAENGDPLPGATVAIKGTTTGAVTDQNGAFSVTVPGEDAVLVISFIGFNTLEIPVRGKSQVNVVLEETATALDEVVVMGFGQVQTKQEQTAAVSTIRAEDIVKAPVGNVTNAITGRMVGVMTRQPQSRPGASEAQIFIRGRSSENSQALIIVDGVERENFGDIDPNDIESISTLKDAASTAAFGLKGANGVIVITTKRGKAGKTQVSYNGSVGLSGFSQIPKPLGSYLSAVLQSEAEDNMASIGRLTHPKFFTPEDIETFRRGDGDPLLYPDVDWFDALMKDNWVRTQHNLSFTGGSRKATFYIALGYMFEDGMYKELKTPSGHSTTPYAKRTNFRSNLDFNLTKSTVLSLSLSGRIENEYTPRMINGQLNPEDAVLTGAEAIFRRIYVTPSWQMPFFPEYTDRSTPDMRALDDTYNQIANVGFGGATPPNPYLSLKRGGYSAQDRNTLETIISLNQKLDFITDGLYVNGTFGYDHIANTIRIQNGAGTVYKVVDRDTKEIGPAFPNPNQYQIEDAFNARNGNTQGKLKTNTQLKLGYGRKFGDHKISASTIATREYDALAGGAAPRTFQGLVMLSSYNFKDKYFVDANGAYQGSENYPASERYGFFPTVGVGYALSEERFMKGAKETIGLDYLKIRASYGIVGFGSPGRFVYLDGYGASNEYFYFGNPNNIPRGTFDPRMNVNAWPGTTVPVYEHTQVGNPMVTWEKSIKRNIGLEAYFLNNRVQVIVDVFDDTRTDILKTRVNTTPVAYGEAMPLYNFGENYNAGIEAELRLANRSGRFDYGVNFQYTHIENEQRIVDEPANIADNLKIAGSPIGQHRGYATDGFFQRQEEIDNHAVWPGFPFMPGDIKLVDINADGVINDLDFTNIGYSNLPVDQYSLELFVSVKGLRLSALFHAVDKVSNEFNPNDNTIQWFPHQLDRWTPENTDAKYPALRDPSSGKNIFYSRNNLGINEFNLQDASYIKLRNIELSYTIPAPITQRFGISGAAVGLTGQNLFTWTNFIGLDPENNDDRSVGYYANRGVTYPNIRTYQFNLRLNF